MESIERFLEEFQEEKTNIKRRRENLNYRYNVLCSYQRENLGELISNVKSNSVEEEGENSKLYRLRKLKAEIKDEKESLENKYKSLCDGEPYRRWARSLSDESVKSNRDRVTYEIKNMNGDEKLRERKDYFNLLQKVLGEQHFLRGLID